MRDDVESLDFRYHIFRIPFQGVKVDGRQEERKVEVATRRETTARILLHSLPTKDSRRTVCGFEPRTGSRLVSLLNLSTSHNISSIYHHLSLLILSDRISMTHNVEQTQGILRSKTPESHSRIDPEAPKTPEQQTGKTSFYSALVRIIHQ